MEDRASSGEKHPIDKWLKLSEEIIRFVTSPSMSEAQARVPPEYVQAGRFLMFQWGRNFRTFKALLLLVQNGYSEDAAVLLRTLLEGYFEVAFMAKHPHEADRYLSYGCRTQAADFKRNREEYNLPDDLHLLLLWKLNHYFLTLKKKWSLKKAHAQGGILNFAV